MKPKVNNKDQKWSRDKWTREKFNFAKSLLFEMSNKMFKLLSVLSKNKSKEDMNTNVNGEITYIETYLNVSLNEQLLLENLMT